MQLHDIDLDQAIFLYATWQAAVYHLHYLGQRVIYVAHHHSERFQGD